MVDLRWVLAVGLMRVLRKVARRNGRFVFAVAGRPTEAGIEVIASDTTAIPAGPAVKAMIDRIVHAHTEAVMRLMMKEHPEMPVALREMLNGLLEKSKETAVDERLPERSWRIDETG